MKTTQNILSSSLIFWVLLAGAVGGGMVGCTNSDIAVSKSGKLTVSDENGYLFSQLAAGGIEEKCINLSNREDAPGDVTITKLEISEGTGRREFRISKVHGQPFKGKFDKISLQPGEETTVCVEYIPNDSSRDSAALVVSVEGDSSLEEGKYTVNISSESTAPILGIPLTVKFPGVLSTEWQCRTQAVSNLGLEKLKINHVSLDDRNRYFHVRFFDSKPTTDCPPGPTRFGGKSVDDVLKEYGQNGALTLTDKVLGSRGSDDSVMWVRYFFMPSAVNSAVASLIFQTNQPHDGGKVTVALSGNTSDVCVESIPSPVDFGEATSTYSQKRSVKITNCSQGKAQKVVKIGNIFLDQAGTEFEFLKEEPTTSEEVKTLLEAATPTPIQLEPQKSIIVDVKFAPTGDPKDSGGDFIEGAIVLGLEGSETSSVKIPLVGKNVKELKPIARIQAKVELAEDIKQNKLTEKNQYSQSILMRNTDELQFDRSSSFVPEGYEVVDNKWVVSYLPKDANDQAIKAIEGSNFGQSTPSNWMEKPGNPRLKIPVAGQYVFTYQICVRRIGDPSSPKVCSDPNDFRSRVSVEVRSDEPIHIQLTWYSTKGTADTRAKTTGADLDLLLSYKGEFWNTEKTCSHKQPNVQFGHNGRMTFERDDRDGDGPESISVSGPTGQDTFYIGVQQYESHGWAETWATLTVYVYGRKYWSTTFSPPPRKFTSVGESSRPFWVVASVQWRASGGNAPASPLIRVIDSFVSSTPEANKVLQRYTKKRN